MGYEDEARSIWSTFVPSHGQADTVQGELLRAVEKLRDEAIRNGNGNWDLGFEILHTFVADRLLDAAVFPAEVRGEIRAILDRLGQSRHPVLEDAPYDFLGDRVVDYYRHYGSLPLEPNPKLWR